MTTLTIARLFIWPSAFGLWLSDLPRYVSANNYPMTALSVAVLVVSYWRFMVALRDLENEE